MPRDTANRRVYDKDSVGRVVLISKLRLAGMPIADIADYVKLVKGAASASERVELLRAHRHRIVTQLDALQFALTVIDYKLAGYEMQEHHERQ